MGSLFDFFLCQKYLAIGHDHGPWLVFILCAPSPVRIGNSLFLLVRDSFLQEMISFSNIIIKNSRLDVNGVKNSKIIQYQAELAGSVDAQ